MKNILISLALSLLLTSTAFALDLDNAKANGQVGETPSGYLAAVSASASQDVKNLVSDINKKRKKKYSEIAESNGTAIEAVEKLAGKKAISITPAGQYVQGTDGKWVRK